MALNQVKCFYKNNLIGTLGVTNHIYFEYDQEFIKSGLELSPIHLPLRLGLHTHNFSAFHGLPGLFYDSLPDSWGMNILSRKLENEGVKLHEISVFTLLCMIGPRAIGAISYEPDTGFTGSELIALDAIKTHRDAIAIVEGKPDKVGKALYEMAGSAGGQRPKIVVGIKDDSIIAGAGMLPKGYASWIIKLDMKPQQEYGKIEHAMMLMAKGAGLTVPQTKVFHFSEIDGEDRFAFGIKRFDRLADGNRVHVHTLSGMVHKDFFARIISYEDLLNVTQQISSNPQQDKTEVYRRLVYNILASNYDDHAKNTSFLFTANDGWRLAPAYDLTPAGRAIGTHEMSVRGKFSNIRIEDAREFGDAVGIPNDEALTVESQVTEALSQWGRYAKEAGLSADRAKQIQHRFDSIGYLPPDNDETVTVKF
ncbi:MAG: type II toxin-antitoxin system HipA family toxin [Verrucomicrobiota bacterium]|nr:type II toxin-antitoxin system HipA family toxin [Verrucomicrobiota bacterium]